jgi:hypothetical protein
MGDLSYYFNKAGISQMSADERTDPLARRFLEPRERTVVAYTRMCRSLCDPAGRWRFVHPVAIPSTCTLVSPAISEHYSWVTNSVSLRSSAGCKSARDTLCAIAPCEPSRTSRGDARWRSGHWATR